ncbi:hypothetical protein MKW98_029531 [Papaver atlanticum]|uniref:F-box/kelch-repeat protein n=1 Tax=Papaver atlanticum TaxID=357466 RepID=A0AAD4SHS2_9MAGN|nr:hypothetical protein MKW98_029531 [Papaver atlanticum]
MNETNSEEAVQIQQTHTPLLTQSLAESWIYVLCRDKDDRLERSCLYVLDPISLKRCWKLVPILPDQCLKRKGMAFEVLGNKVCLLGGCGWFEDATDEVYCDDASRNTWDTAAPLSTARLEFLFHLINSIFLCVFACEALNEKLYAIGGVGSNLSDPHSWDMYDPATNNSFVLDGKICIRCGVSSTMPSNVYVVHANKDLVSAIVVEGNMYVLDQSSGTRLMMWVKRVEMWIAVGRLSPLLTRPPCRLGPSTVSFDVSRAGNVEGLMVSSSIPRLAGDDDVICCIVLSI